MRKSIQFYDSRILNLILFFNLLNFLKYRLGGEMKQTNVISQQKTQDFTLPFNNLSV